jgi:hypothetical protein
MGITDNWVSKDTEIAVQKVLKRITTHRGFRNWLQRHRGTPSLFVAEVQNMTAEAYFPINDINDELLKRIIC